MAEMQQDLSEMIKWIAPSVENGLMSREEARQFLQLSPTENPSMAEYTVPTDIMTIEQSLEDFPTVTND